MKTGQNETVDTMVQRHQTHHNFLRIGHTVNRTTAPCNSFYRWCDLGSRRDNNASGVVPLTDYRVFLPAGIADCLYADLVGGHRVLTFPNHCHYISSCI